MKAPRQPGLADIRPVAKPVKHPNWHQNSRRKVVGKLLDAIATGLPSFLRMFGRHRIPSEDVEKLMAEIKMTTAHNLVTIDQHHIEFRQAAGCAGNALKGIYHQHQ